MRDSSRYKSWDPSISAGIDTSSVSHFPENTLTKDIPAPHHGPPDERGVVANGGIHNVHMFKIPSLEEVGNQRRWPFHNSPNLFGKQSFVKMGKISETHSTDGLGQLKLAPSFPMHFFPFTVEPHQKLAHMA